MIVHNLLAKESRRHSFYQFYIKSGEVIMSKELRNNNTRERRQEIKQISCEHDEESLCDSCENDCYDESMIVDACSRYVKNG